MNLFRSEAQAGWLCPQTYQRDAQTQLIHRRGAHEAFHYSDGAASERHLSAVLRQAKDRSVGSSELADGIHDWASAYHLSAQRADLLRPIAPLLGRNTLEIGAGCGAITRFLGEQGGQVLALEGSINRAKMAHLRCQDLAQVSILVDNFQTANLLQPFDLITLIGVLEYSPKYIAAKDPVGFVLDRARSLLTQDGALVIAIENQMGLKYLSGAPEDHYSIPYLGIEDRYADLAVTFGRAELEALLQRHGFANCEFFYPFGDYKMPACIINQACADATDPFINDLVRGFSRHQPAYLPAFSEEAATGVATRNGLLSHLANSFLVVARVNKAVSLGGAVPRAWAYATTRAKPFAKETLFTKGPKGWSIARRRLHEDADMSQHPHVHLHLQNETALPGRLMYQAFLDIINTPGWGASHLAKWAEPWLGLLMASRKRPERAAASMPLPGSCIDCVPHNVMLCPDGSAVAFDQEWSVDTTVQLGHVMVRGLGMVLTRPRSLAVPASGTPTRVLSLVYQVMALLGLTVSEQEFADYCQAEFEFQQQSGGHPPSPQETLFFSAALQVRRNPGHMPFAPGSTQLTVQQQAKMLKPHFDRAYYVEHNADVKKSGFDPLLHYIAHGDSEGRAPCNWFSPTYYRKRHPDATSLGWPTLLHYVILGKHQGRDVAAPPVVPALAAAPAHS